MTRPSYRRELVTASTFAVAVGAAEGGVVAVLAEKVFDVSDFQFATILAAPMFANLTSWVWAMVSRGRRKIRFIVGLQAAALLAIAAIALLPTGRFGAMGLVALVILARCLLAGIVTLRSAVWRNNYPRHQRARITGKLVTVATLMVATAPLVGYTLLDLNADAFRLLYPVSAAIGVIGVISFSRMRMRGEGELLRYERQPVARPQPHGETGAIYEFNPKETPETRQRFWNVLRGDRHFRAYMIWQFCLGIANMIGEVAIIREIIRMSEGRSGEYGASILLTVTLPMLLAMVTLPWWAKHLDGVHIARFRLLHSPCIMLTQLANLAAAASGLFWLFAIPRTMQGVVRGGGMLAWQLGHHDFADRRMVALYMGIHVTLTGVRGAIAPYLAVVLLDGVSLSWPGVAVDLPGIGPWVFLVTAAGAGVAWAGFYALHRSVRNATA